MNNGKTAFTSGLSCLHFILISTNERAREAFFFSFFFLLATETLVGLLSLSLLFEPAYDLSYRIIFKHRLTQFFVCQSLQNCGLRNCCPFNHVLKQINQFFNMVVAKYALGSFSRIRGCPNFRLMAACVLKHSTDKNGNSFFLNRWWSYLISLLGCLGTVTPFRMDPALYSFWTFLAQYRVRLDFFLEPKT